MKYELVSLRLKEALRDKDMTCADLSRATGISDGSLSQYVNGIHCPSNVTASKIAEVLGVSPVWIMGFDVDKYPVDPEVKGKRDAELVRQFNRLNEYHQGLVMQMIQSLQDK